MFIQFSLLIISLGFVAFGWLFSWNEIEGYLTGLAFLPSLIMAIMLIIGRITDVFHPLMLFSYVLFVSVPIKALYLISTQFDIDIQRLNLGPYPIDSLEGGIWLFIFAVPVTVFGYLIGYLVFNAQKKGPPKSYLSDRGFRIAAVVALLVSYLGIYLFLSATGAFQQILAGQIFAKRFAETDGENIIASFTYLRMIGQTLPQIMLTVAFVQRFKNQKNKNRIDTFLILLLAINSMAIPLLASSRLELAYLLLFIIMALHYFRKRISIRHLAVFGLVGLTALSFLGELRRVQSAYAELDFQFTAADIFKGTVGRPYFMDVGKTSAIVAAVPDDVQYLNGASFTKILIAPIPRSYWPEKPVLAINTFVSSEIMRRPGPSGVPPGLIGELYMNGGYLVVTIGLFLAGLILAFLYNRLLNTQSHPAIYIFLVVLTAFTLFTVEILNYVSGVFRYIVIYSIFVVPFYTRKLR